MPVGLRATPATEMNDVGNFSTTVVSAGDNVSASFAVEADRLLTAPNDPAKLLPFDAPIAPEYLSGNVVFHVLSETGRDLRPLSLRPADNELVLLRETPMSFVTRSFFYRPDKPNEVILVIAVSELPI